MAAGLSYVRLGCFCECRLPSSMSLTAPVPQMSCPMLHCGTRSVVPLLLRCPTLLLAWFPSHVGGRLTVLSARCPTVLSHSNVGLLSVRYPTVLSSLSHSAVPQYCPTLSHSVVPCPTVLSHSVVPCCRLSVPHPGSILSSNGASANGHDSSSEPCPALHGTVV